MIKKYLRSNDFQTLLLALLLAILFRSFVIDPYHIPSGSMNPTLTEGDKIIVNKSIYGYSRYSFLLHFFPIKNRIAQYNKPKRGDIVVFSLPSDHTIYYVKRIIGLPGDKIQVIDGVVIVNDIPLDQERDQDDMFKITETNSDGKSYKIYIHDTESSAQNTEVYNVPNQHYFMMGDNRNNSIDSRFLSQVGFIPERYLVGKVSRIVFSSDSPIYKPIPFVKGIKWQRIFSKPV